MRWDIKMFNIINQISEFFSTVTTIVKGIIERRYNRKLLERRAIIELIRFFIVPLKEWFYDQMGKDTGGFEEFNVEKLQFFLKNSNFRETHTLPPLEILYTHFNSLIERLPHKSEWNEKVQEYNKLTYDLNKKLSELEHNVRKFLDENQDVKRIYDDNAEANKKYPRYDSFKYELARKFYQQYRSSLIGNALAGAWFYAGKEIFEQVIFHNKPILEEIEKLKEERKHVLEKLISILEQLQTHLMKEYNIAHFKEVSVTFISPNPGMEF